MQPLAVLLVVRAIHAESRRQMQPRIDAILMPRGSNRSLEVVYKKKECHRLEYRLPELLEYDPEAQDESPTDMPNRKTDADYPVVWATSIG